MKVRNLAIALALLGIAVGAFALRGYLRPKSPRETRPITLEDLSPNTITQLLVRKIGASNLLAALGNRPLSWAAIESTNYVVYIQNLRNFGCPDETIRDIIITDIGKLYARKRAALRAQFPATPFWQAGTSNAELQAGLRQLEDEQRALVRQLLGVDVDLEWAKFFDTDDSEERLYSFLPPERRQALQAVVSKFDQLEQDLFERTKGLMLEEDQAQLQQLQKAREEEIARLLTPEEHREYELRNSPMADTLREQLSGFEANEDEFRRIFDLQKAYEARLGQMPPGADEEVRSQVAEQAEEALNEELRKTLGEERFAEYLRAQDADYKLLVQFAERVDIPRETANKVYDLKLRVEGQRDVIETDPNMTEQQRALALHTLAATAEKEVTGLMGPNANRYLQVGSDWIRDIPVTAGPISAEAVTPPAQTGPPMPPQLPGFPPFAPMPVPFPPPPLPQR